MLFDTPGAACALLDGNNLLGACKFRNKPKVVGLLRRGDDVNEVNDLGWAPIHMAVRVGDEEIARLLVKAGANVNLTNSFGKTVLHLAAENDHRSLVSFLASEYPSLLDVQDMDGMTALMRAALAGKADTVQLLCSNHHANVDMMDLWGRTAVDLAKLKRHNDIALLMENYLSLKTLQKARETENRRVQTHKEHLERLREIRLEKERRRRAEAAEQKKLFQKTE